MKQANDLSDSQIIAAISDGAPQNFAILVRRYQGRLEGFINSYFRSDRNTGDIVQETFLTAFQNLTKLRNTQNFKSWLFGIAYRKCLYLSRQNRTAQKAIQKSIASYNETTPSHEESITEQSSPKNSLLMLDKLPPLDALLVWLHYIEDIPYLEIAELVEMNDATVRQRCRRALVQLREGI